MAWGSSRGSRGSRGSRVLSGPLGSSRVLSGPLGSSRVLSGPLGALGSSRRPLAALGDPLATLATITCRRPLGDPSATLGAPLATPWRPLGGSCYHHLSATLKRPVCQKLCQKNTFTFSYIFFLRKTISSLVNIYAPLVFFYVLAEFWQSY